MKKIIVTYDASIDPSLALNLVSQVVSEGFASHETVQGDRLPTYCWATNFGGFVVVQRNRKKTTSCHSFHVSDERKSGSEGEE
jgi:hypothetical protein